MSWLSLGPVASGAAGYALGHKVIKQHATASLVFAIGIGIPALIAVSWASLHLATYDQSKLVSHQFVVSSCEKGKSNVQCAGIRIDSNGHQETDVVDLGNIAMPSAGQNLTVYSYDGGALQKRADTTKVFSYIALVFGAPMLVLAAMYLRRYFHLRKELKAPSKTKK